MFTIPWVLIHMLNFLIQSEDASHSSPNQALRIVAKHFRKDYQALHVPQFLPDYLKNFENIPSVDKIKNQMKMFNKYQAILKGIPWEALSASSKAIFGILQYEIDFNRRRLALELEIKMSKPSFTAPQTGLFELPHHENWYKLYIQRQASTKISPKKIADLGLREIRKIKREIQKIQKTLGFENRNEIFFQFLNRDDAYLKNKKKILSLYRKIQRTTEEHLHKVGAFQNIPRLEIRIIQNADKNTPPGYYSNNIFYFSFFEHKHLERNMEWLFIHEGIPGHHIEVTFPRKSNELHQLKSLLYYPGYQEGWAAYTEHLGKEIGLYQNPLSLLAKWEWDLVRSTRLVIDVGIHHEGWTRSQAFAFWKATIPNQDSIAEREIDRMIRWPAQVLSYKVGENMMMRLKRREKKRLGKRFDLCKFHLSILKNGPVPLTVLDSHYR